MFSRMEKHDSLTAGIIRTIVVLFSANAVIFGTLSFLFDITYELILWFYSVLILYHFILFIFLLSMKESFYMESTGKPLERINISNILTISRLSSIPTIIFIYLADGNETMGIILIVLLSIIFFTDLLDGFLARKLNQVTRIGRYMDSISDYLIIFSIAIIFLHSELIPLWFFTLLILRLFIQAGGMGIILLRRGSVEPETSFLGKTSIFATMSLFILEIFKYLKVPYISSNSVMTPLEYIVGIVLVVSIFDKFVFLSKRII